MSESKLMKTLEFKDVTFTRGEGAYLIDNEGKSYLDFFCDVGTSSMGYNCHESLMALRKMVGCQIPIHAPNLFRFNEREEFADRLCSVTDMHRAFFCNSGTEAVEAAIKLSRLYHHKNGEGERDEIWSVKGGFHGRTYGSLSAGDGPGYHYEGFGPFPGEFFHFHPQDWNVINPRAAAIVLAPVFGNNDVQEYDKKFLEDLREYSSKNGIILIFDEVQTGAGRCGSITYARKIGVTPDVICLAKGVAMGAPVGVTLARAPYSDTFTPGTHFSTFGGNPFGCVMGNAMLDWLERACFDIEAKGRILRDVLKSLDWTKNVRGPGMLLAFDVDVDTKALAAECLAEGLIIGAFRSGPGVVKITPPLNITTQAMISGAVKLNNAYNTLVGSRS